MALDRAWYNSLVDDDGSGLTGSVWDKADVDALMDAIDAEIARIDASAGGTSGSWAPTLFGSAGGTPIYTTQQGWYQKHGSLVWIGGRITTASRGSLAGSVALASLPYAINPTIGQAGPVVGFFAGITVPIASMAMYAASGYFFLTMVPAGGATLSQLLDASQIGGFDLIFAGTYLG